MLTFLANQVTFYPCRIIKHRPALVLCLLKCLTPTQTSPAGAVKA
jgi:hypothetical protein